MLPRVRISDKFVPFVSPQRSLATSEEDAQNLIHKVKDIDLSEFERLFFKRWDEVSLFVKYSTVNSVKVFLIFLRTSTIRFLVKLSSAARQHLLQSMPLMWEMQP